MTMETYFSPFREQIIGIDRFIGAPSGQQHRIVYADWIASGRAYKPIEERMVNEVLPLVANTHTEVNATGMAMTHAYHQARQTIKRHVNASADDVLITDGSGMTGVVNKFQRILGFKLHERFRNRVQLSDDERPVVFVTHMEHHSNQTSWLETIAQVEIIGHTVDGLVDLAYFDVLLERFKYRPVKIAAVTSCSNVTGVFTPYHEIAKRIHALGGWCFVDFACSAPYVDINMHPDEPGAHLDAIYFSPHKFLGGPGTSGVLLFNKQLYTNTVPDHPGGGTVQWTNPWGIHRYITSIDEREDGGTPGFLQAIRTAFCIKLKEEMGTANILKREHEQLDLLWPRLMAIPNLRVLAPQHRNRLGVLSFTIDGLNHNLGVKLLNDRFGIQVRGGCACAGTYGHYLLDIDYDDSVQILQQIDDGNQSRRPGFIRLSIHPTMTNAEIEYIAESIKALAANHQLWAAEYTFDAVSQQVIPNDKHSDNAFLQQVDELLARPLH